MATEDVYAELINNGKRMVLEMQEKTFKACTVTVDAASVTNQLQELTKDKPDVKDKVHKTLTINSFMQNLSRPREEWDGIITQNDEELQTARSTLKEAQRTVEDKKTKVMQLNAVAAEALALYQQNLHSLEERLQCLEQMYEDLQTVQESLSGSEADDESAAKEVEAQLAQCSAELKEWRRKLVQMEHRKAQLELQVAHMEEELQQLTLTLDEDQECMDAQCLSKLQKSISDMESLSGVKCKVHNSNTITVEFPPRQPESLSASNADDLVLQVTLTFQGNTFGSLHLSDVKSNIDSFDVDDLWRGQGSGSAVSLPSLINHIQCRWLSHVPLLSEINRLRSQYAIDWIQQKNLLRVIVGKGGGIVCTLHIPAAYPHQGQVTLTDILGTPDSLILQDLKPSMGSRLEDWVHFLEYKFGRP